MPFKRMTNTAGYGSFVNLENAIHFPSGEKVGERTVFGAG